MKVLDIDPKAGKFRLSLLVLISKPEGYEERPARLERPQRGERGDRGPRRDRGERPERRREPRD